MAGCQMVEQAALRAIVVAERVVPAALLAPGMANQGDLGLVPAVRNAVPQAKPLRQQQGQRAQAQQHLALALAGWSVAGGGVHVEGRRQPPQCNACASARAQGGPRAGAYPHHSAMSQWPTGAVRHCAQRSHGVLA